MSRLAETDIEKAAVDLCRAIKQARGRLDVEFFYITKSDGATRPTSAPTISISDGSRLVTCDHEGVR